MKSKKKVKCHINNKRYLYLGLMLFVLTVVFVEPTYCEILDEGIRGATERVIALASDWSVPLIIGSLFAAGGFFMYGNTGIAKCAIGGSIFIAAAKLYASSGTGALLSAASQFFQI